MKKTWICIARILISLIFLFAGAGKLMNWEGVVDALSLTFSNWYMHLEGGVISNEFHEFLIGSVTIIMGIAIFLEIVGGLLLLIGYKVRLGALFLLIFLVPVTLIFHAFWFEIGPDQHTDLVNFLKNLSIIGALIYLLAAPQPERAAK